MKWTVIPCTCYDPLHNVQISEIDPDWDELYINVVVASDQNLWVRIKNVLKYLFFGESVTVGDMCLNRAQAMDLVNLINNELEKEI